MPVCKMEVLMWMLPFPQPNLYLVHGIRRHCGARVIKLLLLLYYCVYIVARSVYCPLSTDNICAIAFSVWPLLLKETLLLSSVSVSGDLSVAWPLMPKETLPLSLVLSSSFCFQSSLSSVMRS